MNKKVLVSFTLVSLLALLELASLLILNYREALPTLKVIPGEYLRDPFVPSQTNVKHDGTVANINAHGFRGKELAKSPVRRIVTLGDSVTFGYKATDDEGSYPAILETLLPDGTEVINAGMPRYNTMDLLDFYIAKIIPLKPDAIVLQIPWNELGFYFTRPFGAPLRKEGIAAVLDKSAFFRLVQKFIWKKKNTARHVLAARVDAADDIDWSRVDEWENVVRSFVTLVRSNGAEMLLMTSPHYLSADMTEDQKKRMLPLLMNWKISYGGWERMIREINKRLRLIATELQVPLAECEDKIDSRFFVDFAHMDDEGNRILAVCIEETLKKLSKVSQA